MRRLDVGGDGDGESSRETVILPRRMTYLPSSRTPLRLFTTVNMTLSFLDLSGEVGG